MPMSHAPRRVLVEKGAMCLVGAGADDGLCKFQDLEHQVQHLIEHVQTPKAKRAHALC